jgi:multiple sugar transport system substrate-binding protein
MGEAGVAAARQLAVAFRPWIRFRKEADMNDRNATKAKATIALVGAVAALVLAACAPAPAVPAAPAAGETTTAPEQPAAAPAGDEKVTLRLWSHQNAAFNKVNQDLIDKFMQENPNIEVKYETFPYEEFQPTLATSMPAKTEADVMELFGTWVCGYARGGRLMEVPPDVMTYGQAKDLYFQAPLDGYYCDGKLYGLPHEFNLENGGVLVNPELFKKHGLQYPPEWKTFDDVIADAQKLTEFDDNGTMTKAGFHATGGDGIPFAFMAGILQQGGDYFASDGKHFNFESPEARAMAQKIVDWALKDKVVDPVLFNNTETANPLPDSFFQGNIGIGFIGSWAAGTGLQTYPDFKFDYVTIPPYFGAKNIYAADAGWGKVVSVNTQHPAEAWKLAQFMAANRENAQLWNGTTGTIPALKEIVANPEEFLKMAPWVKPTFALLPDGKFMGNVGDRDKLWYDIIHKHLLDAMQGNITVDEALKNINTEANEMIDAQP